MALFELRQDIIKASQRRNAKQKELTELLKRIGVDKVQLKGDTEVIIKPPCKNDAECPPDKPKCINGKCRIPPVVKLKCKTDADCPPDKPECFKGTCQEKPGPQEEQPEGVQEGEGFDTEEDARAAAIKALETERSSGIILKGD